MIQSLRDWANQPPRPCRQLAIHRKLRGTKTCRAIASLPTEWIRLKFYDGSLAKSFALDSICPSGAGKVAGVKIENHDEKLAGVVEVMARFNLLWVAVEGISPT